MAYDDALSDRILEVLADRGDVSERRMFGGWCAMVAGNMACGVIGDELMVRVGQSAYEDALDLPHARVMDVNGRPMTGFVVVRRAGIKGEAALRGWVERGVTFAASLPPK